MRSICADIPESVPDAFSKCSTTYPMCDGFRLVIPTVSEMPEGIPKGFTPVAYWGIFSGSETKRKENALISYGIFEMPICGT